MEQTENITDEIAKQILAANSFMFMADAGAMMQNSEKVNNKDICFKAMLKYGKQFFEQLKALCPDIGYGFSIGLTKQFLDFSLKAIIKADKNADEKKIDNLFSLILQKTIPTTAQSVNNDTAVYIIYGRIKKTADEITK